VRLGFSSLSNPEEIELRANGVVVGAVLGCGTAVAIVTYLALSSESHHKALLAAVCAVWGLLSAGLVALPRRRIAASRWREPFFLTWSAAVVGSVAVGIVLEGNPRTPLTLGFILPLIFAAISYPVAGTAVVGLMVLLGATASSVLVHAPAANTTFVVLALAFAAVMGVWQAGGRGRRNAQLAAMAYHDGLTGLANRAQLEEHLTVALARAARHGGAGALLYIDLDHFKIVNDTLGHDAGDALLRQVATRLSARTRAGDVLARHGGDEFMLLLSVLDGDPRVAAAAVAHDVLATLETPFQLHGHEFEVAASIGAATFPHDSDVGSELLKRADAALYEAKRDGRGAVRFHAAESSPGAGALTLTARLRRALARDELELHYQPVFDVASGAPVAVEALLRWHDPDRGMVPPGEFIPAAESSGLIEPIGDWVVDAVLAQAQAWRAEGLEPDIAFNLSPRQLRAPGFADRLLERIAASGIEPARLIAEVTESAAMTDPERTGPLFERLAGAGLRLAIDDFGADFSSLARLRDLPVSELKIDRAFLRGVPGDARSAAIVIAIVQLAHALELTSVAEGVEEAAQLEFLAAPAAGRRRHAAAA
jgi:diguanylate cyclase (GGDEF)-like protein